MPWREIFIVVCFVAAVVLAAPAYFWRNRSDKEMQWFAAVLLATGTLFTGVALLLDDWVIVVGLAAGAVTAVAVGFGGVALADRLKSQRVPEDARRAREEIEAAEWRAQREYGRELERSREQDKRSREEAERSREEAERREYYQKVQEVEARIAAAAAGLGSASLDDRFAAVSELAALSTRHDLDRIRDLLAGHVRIRARDGDGGVSPDVEAALAALGRGSGQDPTRPVNLAGAYLRGLVLADADLQGAVLSRADLEGALLEQVNLASARLTDANLRRVRFDDVDLSGASLSGADLSGATYDETTKWPEGFDPNEAVVPQR